MSALSRWITAPFDNPVLRREIKLVTRRGRFEWVVFVLTVAMTLVIASVGGRAGAHPAQVGKVLFQTFFGIAHGLVLVAGPAVAASSIAAEREGRTYEALALTGLAPNRIARGKFFAAMANVGAYVIALAPVGALPFLFGGVSALAMVFAFGMLFVTTALAVLFGLAISARLPTTRSALITSVVGGATLAIVLYSVLGETVGNAVCESMGVQRAGTIWLPVLLAEGDLSAAQIIVLVATPLTMALLLGWFLFEVCVANLSDPSADRTTGIKRWFSVSVALGALIASLPVLAGNSLAERGSAAISGIAAFVLFAVFAAFVFQGDALIAPRRVRILWAARNAGGVRRFFGPGVTSSAALQLVAAVLVIGTLVTVTLVCAVADEFRPPASPLAVVVLSAPAAMFVLFVVGLSTWLRVRYGANVGRIVLAIVLVVVCVAPYAATAILGGGQSAPDSLVSLLASPSPAYALEMARHIAADQTSSEEVLATLLCTAGYTVIGIVTLASAMLTADRTLRERDADAARMDAVIAQEDAQAAAGATPSSAVLAPPAHAKTGVMPETPPPVAFATAPAAASNPSRDDARWMPPVVSAPQREEREPVVASDPSLPRTAPGFAALAPAAPAPALSDAASRIAVPPTPVAGSVLRAETAAPAIADPLAATVTDGARESGEPAAPRVSHPTPPHGTIAFAAVTPPPAPSADKAEAGAKGEGGGT